MPNPAGAPPSCRPVLVVDDEAVLLDLIADVLTDAGYQVSRAIDGAAALDAIATTEFGVVVLDKNLPGERSGLDVLRNIRRRWPLTRVMLLTGYPSKESILQALKDGAFDYLEKPIDNDLLVEQVHRAWQAYALAVEREELFRKYETLFEIVPGIVWFMTEEGVIRRINREGAAMLGYTPGELAGQRYQVLIPPRVDKPAVHWAFKERRTGPRATRGQLVEMVTRAGATKLFEVFSTGAYDRAPQEPGARYWGTLGVGWDVTEHMVLEEQLQQARKMEALGRLAGGVAHDFNNLLAVVINNADFLKQAIPEGSGNYDDLLQIERAAQRGADMVSQLLTFSRKPKNVAGQVDLSDVVRGLQSLLRRVVNESIELTFDLEAEPTRVVAAASQIEQVVLNLAANARDAMPDGGHLTVQTRNVVLDAEFAASHLGVRPGAYVMVAVSDTGHGMSPEVREHLFEPFFTTKSPGKGTGLGLATVYGIVTQCAGHISIYSEADAGTSVKVYLPAHLADEPRTDLEAATLAEPPAGGGEMILVVEDEPMVRRLAKRILERAGYRVLVTEDGEAALAAAEQQPLDLALTDVVMPKIGGTELAVRLRERFPRLGIVYMSGYIGQITTQHPMLEQGAAFVQKPFTAAVLLQAVRRVLDEMRGPT